ncbi:HNH endonuclease signature motif containing protein [Rhodococcoides trifolii]|uniref:HNH endonuclease signature motif containing protein n=1 Tax=Rhodococcoides trifolii TaxID=908250 RepID=UPI001666A3CF|nr:HNH endonuclease signature motif containing protein [Rhodococcus trifolii]
MSVETARAMLAGVADSDRAANIADAVRIDTIADYYEARTRWPERTVDSPDSTYIHNSVVAEMSAQLASTCPVIDGLLNLRWRMRPAVHDAFVAGDLPLTKVRVIANHISGVPAAVMNELDEDVVACARVLAPGPLGTEIDRLVRAMIPDWDEKARKLASEAEKKVRIIPMRHGLKKVIAVVDAAEGAELGQRMTDARRTLCHADSRTPGEKLSASFVAVMRGNSVACECGDEECPHRDSVTPTPSTNLTHITVDLETVLGLGSAAPYLHGYGPLDPDTAARLMADGTWQAIFLASRRFLDTLTGGEPYYGDTPGTAPDAYRSCDCTSTDAKRLRDIVFRAHDYEDADAEERAGAAAVVLGRTRKLRPGHQPRIHDDRDPVPVDPACRVVDYWTHRFRCEPEKCHAEYPDGHGGFATPPPGALTYAPGAALAEYVRGQHHTCVHPGCQVPSARCDLDHVVEFDHADPLLGGWTIGSNLRPLCRRHHNMKTDKHWDYEILPDGTIHARDSLGNDYFRPLRS